MKIFRLPTIYMVGGETHNITLNIKNSCFEVPASNVTATLSISNYVNNTDAPIISMTKNDNDNESGIIYFTLKTSDTISLNGKYVYQICLTNGSDYEMYNGFIVIYKNRNPGVIGG